LRLDVDLDGIETAAPVKGGWPGVRLQVQKADRWVIRGWWTSPEPVEFDHRVDVLGIRKLKGGLTWEHHNALLGGRSLYGDGPILQGTHPFLGGYLFTGFYVPPGLAGDIYTWQPAPPAVKVPLVVAWRCVKTGNGWAGTEAKELDRVRSAGALAQWVPLRALVPAGV